MHDITEYVPETICRAAGIEDVDLAADDGVPIRSCTPRSVLEP